MDINIHDVEEIRMTGKYLKGCKTFIRTLHAIDKDGRITTVTMYSDKEKKEQEATHNEITDISIKLENNKKAKERLER